MTIFLLILAYKIAIPFPCQMILTTTVFNRMYSFYSQLGSHNVSVRKIWTPTPAYKTQMFPIPIEAVSSDVRRKICPENFIFFWKISIAFFPKISDVFFINIILLNITILHCSNIIISYLIYFKLQVMQQMAPLGILYFLFIN